MSHSEKRYEIFEFVYIFPFFQKPKPPNYQVAINTTTNISVETFIVNGICEFIYQPCEWNINILSQEKEPCI